MEIPTLEKKTEGNKNPPFGRFPKWLLDYGVIKTLTRNDLAVLCVLIIRADNYTDDIVIRAEQIAEDSGVYPKSVYQSLFSLKMAEIIEKSKKGNWNRLKVIHRPTQSREDYQSTSFHPFSRKKRKETKNRKRRSNGRFSNEPQDSP